MSQKLQSQFFLSSSQPLIIGLVASLPGCWLSRFHFCLVYMQEGRLFQTLSQPEGVMTCGMCMVLQFMAVTEQASFLLAGYEDGTVALWDLASRAHPTAVQKLHAEPMMALAVHGKGKTFIAAGLGNCLKLSLLVAIMCFHHK